MTGLPGYDNWKTHNPDDDRCEYCGASPAECRAGWQPDRCTGECGRVWRDPDYERERDRDDDPSRGALAERAAANLMRLHSWPIKDRGDGWRALVTQYRQAMTDDA